MGASSFDEKALEEVKSHNLKENLKEIPLFYARGAWNENTMTFRDRTLCNWTDKKYLLPLLQYVKAE